MAAPDGKPEPRKPGAWKGKLWLAEDWDSDEVNEEIARDFDEHAWAAGALPPHHRDPFDRMLVAQAQLEGFTIVTRDPKIAAYQVAVLAA